MGQKPQYKYFISYSTNLECTPTGIDNIIINYPKKIVDENDITFLQSFIIENLYKTFKIEKNVIPYVKIINYIYMPQSKIIALPNNIKAN